MWLASFWKYYVLEFKQWKDGFSVDSLNYATTDNFIAAR